MEMVITFFRDTLNGPLYIAVAIICGILACSCIGYLAEQHELKKSTNNISKTEPLDARVGKDEKTEVSNGKR